MLSKSPERALKALNEPNTYPKDSVKAELTHSMPKPIIDPKHTHAHAQDISVMKETLTATLLGRKCDRLYLSVYKSLCVMFDNACAQQSTSALKISSINF